MAPNEALIESAHPWHPGSPEARWLADALRSCRLSLLCGEAGSGKTSLLSAGLLPLLRRRAEDAHVGAARGASPMILPFPERRSASRARLAELVVFMGSWGRAPLTALNERIDQALREAGVEPDASRPTLTDRVQALGDRHGTRLLFILDGFDTLLSAPERGPEHDELVDSLVQLLNRRLPANAVIAVRSPNEPLFQAFADRLYSVEAEVLMLPHAREQATAVPPPLRAVSRDEPQPIDDPASPAPVQPDDIYDDIARTLAHTLKPPIEEPWREAGGFTVKAALHEAPDSKPAPAQAADEPPASARPVTHAAAAAAEPGAARDRRFWWLAAGLAFVAVALRLVLTDHGPVQAAAPTREAAPAAVAARVDAPSTNAPATPAPAQAPARVPIALPPQPRVDLLVSTDGDVPRLPTELAAVLAADSGVDLHVKVAGSEAASWRATAGSPHLVVLRYDALQRAAALKNKPALSVIAPLYLEEIFFVVRADSPLRSVHQLRGKRINAGAPDSGRALTAQAVYRGLFGQAMPKAADARLDASAALRELANGHTAGRGLDAVMLVAPAPDSQWATLPADIRDKLKLLRLDTDDAASRQALKTYLPATLRGEGMAAAGTPTLASMAFLVVAGSPNAEQADSLGRLAQAMCSSLPGLQRSGATKWREVRAGLQLDSGWPAAGAAAAAWNRCASPPATARTAAPEAPGRAPIPSSTTLQKGATS